MDFKFGGYIYKTDPNRRSSTILEKMECGRIQRLPNFLGTPIISGKVKAADFKFGGYIYMANPNKRPLKFLEKRERGRIQGLPKFFGYPLLSREWVKLQTSNFVGTFIGLIRTKAYENVGNSTRWRSQGVPKNFREPMYRAHCAVIFAIAQLSCYLHVNALFVTLCHMDLTGFGNKPFNW